MPPVFVDANVAIHAIGREHPLRAPCIEVLMLAQEEPACVSSAEVLQEILYVFQRRGQLEKGRAAIHDFDEVLSSRIEPVTREDVLRAAGLDLPPTLQARDRLHLAVMARLGVTRIISVDSAFDAAPGVERLDPRTLPAWRDSVFGGAR